MAGGSRFFDFLLFSMFFCVLLFLHCLFNVLDLSVLFLVMHVPPSHLWGVAQVAGGSRFFVFLFFSMFFCFFCFFLFLHCLFNVLDLSVLFLAMVIAFRLGHSTFSCGNVHFA